MRLAMLGLILLGLVSPAFAQRAAKVHAELPSADQPARNVPTTSYTLALIWTPEYCHAARGARATDPQCSPAVQRAGFTLHGLWPDGAEEGRWPQYCHPVAILSEAQTRTGLTVTPSPQLLQHEWAKHGSCMGDDPARYFAEEARLYRQVVLPDMARLARTRGMTAGDIAAAFARANPRLPANAIRIHANRRNWLEEIWLCLDRSRRFAACAASQSGGAKPDQIISIETRQSRHTATNSR